MAGKRKDSKNKVLLKGESERKDGTYMFRYTDVCDKRQTIYAPTLNELRQKKALIQKDIDAEIDLSMGNMTVAQLLDLYVSGNKQWKPSTKIVKLRTVNLMKQHKICSLAISQVKPIHIKEYFIYLYENQGLTKTSITGYKFILRPAFEMAVENDWIRRNPATIRMDFLPNKKEQRQALSHEDEKRFLEFIQSHNKYARFYDMYVILIETGLRISEFLGLTLDDIDLKERVVDVNHQICVKEKDEYGKMFYIDSYLKTPQSKRKIYITDRAYKSFINLIERRKYASNVEVIIDGYSHFLLTSHTKLRIISREVFSENLRFAVSEYNETHDIPLPKISAHVFRHTFCSRMAEQGVDVKTLQRLMGHAQVQTSLDIYAHIETTQVIQNMKRVVDSQRNDATKFTPIHTPIFTPNIKKI